MNHRIVIAALLLWAAVAPLAAQAGAEAAGAIIEQLDRTNTNGTNETRIIAELREVVRKAGEDHPNDAQAVKQAAKDHIAAMRGRKSSPGKPGGQNNADVRRFLNDLENRLKDLNLISAPAPGWLPAGLTATATGTGHTTGHIADLKIANTTGLPVRLDLGALFIPSDDTHQPYIVPSTPPIVVPPGGAAVVPLEGFCADIRRPPAPFGLRLPPLSAWTRPQPLPSGWAPHTNKGWAPGGAAGALIPGTDIPLGHTINPDLYPEEAAPILLEAVARIAQAFDEMKNEGAIHTPFSHQSLREREAVVQHSFWKFAATISGEQYELGDFALKTAAQFETNTGRDFEGLPENAQRELASGIADFWHTFEAVGERAKIASSPLETPADTHQFGVVEWIKDLLGPDYGKVKKPGDFDNFRRVKYDRYAEERAVNKKSHEEACKAVGISGKLAEACKRVYENEKKK
jgi:hypothetical protein